MSLGEYIAAKRKEKGWSQRDLATASNISNAEISRLESGDLLTLTVFGRGSCCT